eukprot:TRINITY_DN5224_c0_g2_i1.p1 TRINITY_DN5224_c0_g2~~TRINITY_DN5224_c0_g2_i1.p1  ORF type:complete len:252 (-),score=64.40 TRINITY_DN5224_c0_g2_i1:189-944(-)
MHKNFTRELVATGIQELHSQKIFTSLQVEQALDHLLAKLHLFMMEIPFSAEVLTVFLARLVLDEVLFPSTLHRLAESHPVGTCAASVVAKARIMLSAPNRLEVINGFWVGSSSSPRDLEKVKVQIKTILQEYLASCDLDEAVQSLWELDIPYMQHEVVKRALVLALDGQDEAKARVNALLATLSAHGLVSCEQMELGFERVFGELNDLMLDVPNADAELAVLFVRARANGCLSSCNNIPDAVQSRIQLIRA